jgi:hypothetical protein
MHQCIVSSDAAIQTITASEKPSTRVHAPCWYAATFTMVPRPLGSPTLSWLCSVGEDDQAYGCQGEQRIKIATGSEILGNT